MQKLCNGLWPDPNDPRVLWSSESGAAACGSRFAHGIHLYESEPSRSPFVRRALAGELPAKVLG